MNLPLILAGVPVAILLTAAPILLPPGAQAAAARQTAYWWKLQSGTGPLLPAPAVVPAGGLWVSTDPSGPQAVSAIRAALPPDAESVSLRLVVSRSDGTAASIVACPAVDPWDVQQAGAWNDAPRADCTLGSSLGLRSADGAMWTFEVDHLARDRELDVVLLPAQGTLAFSISFAPPDAGAVSIQPGSSPVPTEVATREPQTQRWSVSPPVTGDTGAPDAGAPDADIRADARQDGSGAPIDPAALVLGTSPGPPPNRRFEWVVALLAALLPGTWVARARLALRRAAAHPLAIGPAAVGDPTLTIPASIASRTVAMIEGKRPPAEPGP